MRRIRGERGAVGVVVALLIVPLIGFAAISIDVAAMWGERQQLQTGADAGAFAIAQDCAKGDCKSPTQTAQDLATKNLPNGSPTATLVAAPTAGAGQVTVRNVGVQKYWFAPVLGFDQGTITTKATVAWGGPTGGTSALPLAFSWCEFQAQTGGVASTDEHTILFTKSSNTGCTGPSGNVVPGGFGWIAVIASTCSIKTSISEPMKSDPGKSEPSSCTNQDFEAVQNKTVLLPLFDKFSSSGNNAEYHVFGYAAFTITGYHLNNNGGCYNSTTCNGDDRSIKGYFTRFVDRSEAFTYGAAPDLGANVISLTE